MQGASTFPPKVSDFIRPWRTAVALLGQDFDRFRYFESPFVAYRWHLLVDRDLYFLQPGRVLIPSPSLLPQLSNIRESSRARFKGSLYLGRSFIIIIIVIIIIIIFLNELIRSFVTAS